MQQSRVAGRTIGHRTTAADTKPLQTGQRIMMIKTDWPNAGLTKKNAHSSESLILIRPKSGRRPMTMIHGRHRLRRRLIESNERNQNPRHLPKECADALLFHGCVLLIF